MSKPENPNSLKILCICRGGVSRSVGMATVLKYLHGHDALACGIEGNSKKTIAMLSNWAERIICMRPEFTGHVPTRYRHKVMVCDVGYDRYHQGTHPDLAAQCEDFIARNGLKIGDAPTVAKPKKGTKCKK